MSGIESIAMAEALIPESQRNSAQIDAVQYVNTNGETFEKALGGADKVPVSNRIELDQQSVDKWNSEINERANKSRAFGYKKANENLKSMKNPFRVDVEGALTLLFAQLKDQGLDSTMNATEMLNQTSMIANISSASLVREDSAKALDVLKNIEASISTLGNEGYSGEIVRALREVNGSVKELSSDLRRFLDKDSG